MAADGAPCWRLLRKCSPPPAAPLVHTLRRLRVEHARLLRAQGVTVISLSLEHQLVRTLVELREGGVRLSLVYVVGSSFAEAAAPAAAPLLPFLPPRHPSGTAKTGGHGPQGAAGSEPHDPDRVWRESVDLSIPPETRGSLLALASAGIPCLTVSRGDNLIRALSLGRVDRRREARRG